MCTAVTDPCAEGSKVGVGGWFISKKLAEIWVFSTVHAQWPFPTKEVEIRAHARRLDGCVPTGAANAASEAGVHKLFTTSWPLQVFLQLMASHVPSEFNIWADQLSRGNLNIAEHRSRAEEGVLVPFTQSSNAGVDPAARGIQYA